MMLRSRKPLERLAVDLGHDQRHVRVHAELRGVVDHHAARGRGARRMDLGDGGAGREQAEVEALEVEVLERTHAQHVVLAEAHLLAGRSPRGERHHLVDRELPLGEDVQHLVPDRAGRADHRHSVAHVCDPAAKVCEANVGDHPPGVKGERGPPDRSRTFFPRSGSSARALRTGSPPFHVSKGRPG